MKKKKERRLTKVEKFYIANHLHLTAADLAIQTKIPADIIEKEMSALNEELKKSMKLEDPQQENGPRMPTADDLFARNRRFGAVAMTPQSSQLGDETRKAARKNAAEAQKGFIQKIK